MTTPDQWNTWNASNPLGPGTLAIINNESGSNGSNSIVTQILLVIIPVIAGSFIGLVTWSIRGFVEKHDKVLSQHKDDKKKYIIDCVKTQIGLFYWPLHLHLIRYRQLVERYKEFKEGHFSLSSGDSLRLKRHSDSVVKPNEPMGGVAIDINPDPEVDPESQGKDIHLNEHKHLRSDKTNQTESASPEGLGLDNSLRIIRKFNQAIVEYETYMTETLKQIQGIYTEHAPIAEPSPELLAELIRLDEYITYIVAFRDLSEKNSSDAILEEKIQKAKFPEKVHDLISKQLDYLQNAYNDLIYNLNSTILDDSQPLLNKKSQ